MAEFDEAVLNRAQLVADRAVEEEETALADALDATDVAAIERSFYRVFQRIYLEGYKDGCK